MEDILHSRWYRWLAPFLLLLFASAPALAQEGRALLNHADTNRGTVKVLIRSGDLHEKPDATNQQFSLGAEDTDSVFVAPDLLAPPDGAVLNWDVYYDFMWTHVPGASNYELQLPGATPETLYVEGGLDTTLSIGFSGSGNVSLDWRVRGTDVEGAGPWSQSRHITIADATAPPSSAPELISPLERAIVEPLQNIMFTWGSVFGATGYRIQFDSFTPLDVGDGLDTVWQFEVNGLHHWRVLAYNEIGDGPWSTSRSILVQPKDPGQPDTVRIGCPITVDPVVVGDSFEVPVYVYYDEFVYDINMAFEYENTAIVPSSVSLMGSVVPQSQQDALFVGFNTGAHYFTISWTDPSLQLPLLPIKGMSAEPLLSVYFKVLQPAYGETRDIDTLVMPQMTEFTFDVDSTNIEPLPYGITPIYSDCGMADIVFAAKTAPYFVSPPTPMCGSILTAYVGEDFSFDIEARDSTLADKVSLSAGDLPLGASLITNLPVPGNPVTGTFDWTPLESQIGSYDITITAIDSIDGFMTDCGFQINVMSPDPLQKDTVRIGCPVIVDPLVVGDTFAVPIYGWWDDYVFGFTLSFEYDPDVIEASSIAAADMSPLTLLDGSVDTLLNTVTLEFSDMSGQNPLLPLTQMQGVPLGTIYFRVKQAAYGQTVSLTPTGLGQGMFQFIASADGLTGNKMTFTPEAVTCDGEEILLGQPGLICGDVDGNGSVSVTDAVYLVQYLTNDGPAPIEGTADVDGCGTVNIADVAYLLRAIFANGPAPCESDSACEVLDSSAEVKIGCPVEVRAGDVDSFAVEALCTIDSTLRAISLPLSYSGIGVELSSVDFSNSVLSATNIARGSNIDTANNEVTIFWASITSLPGNLQDERLATLWFSVAPDAPGQTINIDTGFIAPGGEFIMAPSTGGVIYPSYTDCGAADITILPAIEPLSIIDYYPMDTLMVDDTIRVTFSQAINRQTMSPTTLQVLADGTPISGNRLFADGDSTIIFVPTDVFPPLKMITLDVNGVMGVGGEVFPSEPTMLPEWHSGFGVYPGDLNNDGIVNDSDIDQLVQFWHETGPTRFDFSLRWRVGRLQGAHAWPSVFATYADGNGDGIVNENDLFPIGRHFGEQNPYGILTMQLSQKELAENYRTQIQTLYDAIAGNTEPFMVRARQRLARLLGMEILPDEFAVSQNFPNPFNPETSIRLSLPTAAQVNVTIFNASGQQVRSLVERQMQAGEHVVTWDGKDQNGAEVASGVYFYRVTAGDFSESRKMLLLR